MTVKNVLSLISLGAMALGLVADAGKNYVQERRIDERIDKKINEALNHKEESESTESSENDGEES